MEQINYEQIDEILQKYNCNKTKVIAIMQEVQAIYRYLPQATLQYVADKVGISLAKIYGIATFYGNFAVQAKGKYVIKVCRGTACHVKHSENVLNKLYDILNLNEDKTTTDDGLFSIEIVNCLGACSLSPVVMVNEDVYAQMNEEKCVEMIENIRKNEGK